MTLLVDGRQSWSGLQLGSSDGACSWPRKSDICLIPIIGLCYVPFIFYKHVMVVCFQSTDCLN